MSHCKSIGVHHWWVKIENYSIIFVQDNLLAGFPLAQEIMQSRRVTAKHGSRILPKISSKDNFAWPSKFQSSALEAIIMLLRMTLQGFHGVSSAIGVLANVYQPFFRTINELQLGNGEYRLFDIDFQRIWTRSMFLIKENLYAISV